MDESGMGYYSDKWDGVVDDSAEDAMRTMYTNGAYYGKSGVREGRGKK